MNLLTKMNLCVIIDLQFKKGGFFYAKEEVNTHIKKDSQKY